MAGTLFRPYGYPPTPYYPQNQYASNNLYRSFISNPTSNTVGYTPRPWQGQYQQGQSNRYPNTNTNYNNAPRIDRFNRQPLQITSGGLRSTSKQPPTTNQSYRSNKASNQPNRPWLNRSFIQQSSPSTNSPAVRAYHEDAISNETPGETEPSEPYDDHQNYESYEEQFYEGAYWAGHDEHQRTSIENLQQGHDEMTTSQNETTNALFTTSAPRIECRNCRRTFTSGNKLHTHLRAGCKSANGLKPTKTTKITTDPKDVTPGSLSKNHGNTMPPRCYRRPRIAISNLTLSSNQTPPRTRPADMDSVASNTSQPWSSYDLEDLWKPFVSIQDAL